MFICKHDYVYLVLDGEIWIVENMGDIEECKALLLKLAIKK